MTADIYIVQHGEKSPEPGDPPLTERGVSQATITGTYLRERTITSIVSSPLRRARETAECMATRLVVEIRFDARLRERMNWEGDKSGLPLSRFLADWSRATRDRDFVPASGDSSRDAGLRFENVLTELRESRRGRSVAVVAHGGVTIDLLTAAFKKVGSMMDSETPL